MPARSGPGGEMPVQVTGGGVGGVVEPVRQAADQRCPGPQFTRRDANGPVGVGTWGVDLGGVVVIHDVSSVSPKPAQPAVPWARV